jgi:hypothetical protein
MALSEPGLKCIEVPVHRPCLAARPGGGVGEGLHVEPALHGGGVEVELHSLEGGSIVADDSAFQQSPGVPQGVLDDFGVARERPVEGK